MGYINVEISRRDDRVLKEEGNYGFYRTRFERSKEKNIESYN